MSPTVATTALGVAMTCGPGCDAVALIVAVKDAEAVRLRLSVAVAVAVSVIAVSVGTVITPAAEIGQALLMV